MGFVAAAAPLAPGPVLPIATGVYLFGCLAVAVYASYRDKQARQQKLSEEEKEIASKEFFAKKVTYEWNQIVKQGPARKPFYLNLKNVENGKDEHCFVVAGDLDNRTFTHVAVSKLNNIHQGSFHILVRHYSQFRTHIHASRLPDLSNRARTLLEKCEQAKNHADRNRAYTELENYLESPEGVVDGIVLDELQFSIFHYIRNQMTHSNFVGYIVDDQRRISYHFKIGTKILRVVLSSQIYNEQPQTIRKKFREIITAYFIDPKTVEGKLKMPKLPMKRRRRQYFVDFIV